VLLCLIYRLHHRALGFSQPPRILDDSEKVFAFIFPPRLEVIARFFSTFFLQHELIKNAILKNDRQSLHQERRRIEDWEGDGGDEDLSREDGAMASAISYFTQLIRKSKRSGHETSRFSADDRSVVEDFEQMKKSLCSVDQDDTVPLSVRLFKEHPQILELYQSRYQYVLIDEFQVSRNFNQE
jgi:superfamily I DNA/RNA helicase